ncbi:MAG: sigma 54-interacting transcriptional regulator [Clostridiales Family XIII bacterium]|jgi:DNA-binding NtrC family response regulator|nr:sigma 54-interacting transcriptional regulator [Clostridiales Family XIII bacterium]
MSEMKNKKYIHDDFGTYRSVRPEGYFPYSAWEIDNNMEITDHEVLLDVKRLNIDMTCFLQLMESSYGDRDGIARGIMDLVRERGKLHNPVTGTGGTLLGTVAKIGAAYSNRYGIGEGDDVISLSSLTGIPLSISHIRDVDTDMAQVRIDGQAILFENSPVVKKSGLLPDDLQLSAFETIGEAAETYRIVEPGDRVIIIGAAGKFGLVCGLAARAKLGGTGSLTGVVDSADGMVPGEMKGLFDEAYVFEASDIAAMRRELTGVGEYDVVINCSQRPMSEPVCVMLPRGRGKVFFTNLGANSKAAGLAAEILGKELSVRFYHGYLEDQERTLVDIIRKTPDFERLLRAALANDFRYPWLQILDTAGRLFKLSRGIIEDPQNYVFESPKSLELLETLIRVAKYDCTILVSGETGVGKEIAAEVIHKKSWRKSGRLVKVNCASIPEHLLETELFGYVGGAFTGSDPKGKKGLWEIADKGVLFLDEIGEMPLALQAKLLRALEENEIFRVGSGTPVKVNVRVIAATNSDLMEMVREKTFREDLYYRLNVFYLRIPPLRERREDILPLVELMLRKYGDKYGINKTMDRTAAKLLETFPWYGNIRELGNFVQKVLIDSRGSEITVSDINRHLASLRVGDAGAASPYGRVTLHGQVSEKVLPAGMDEESLFRYYKEKYGSTRKIASVCGMSQSSVTRRLRKYGLNT